MTTGSTGRNRPAYQQIADDLLSSITEGRVAPGERLPTEQDLCRAYGKTRPTVRQAYRVLIDNGWVDNRGTAGYFVHLAKPRLWRLSQAGKFVDPWEAARDDTDIAQRPLVRVESTDKRIRGRRLADIFTGESRAACRSTVRYLDGDPVELVDTYAPYSAVMASAFMDPAHPPGGTEGLVGGDVTGFVDIAAARRASGREIELLELSNGSPVMEIIRLLHLAPDDRCGLIIHSIYRSDGAEFRHDSRPA